MNDYPGRKRIEKMFSGRLVMVAPEAHKAYGLAAAVRGLKVLTSAGPSGVAALEELGAHVEWVPSAPDAASTAGLVSTPEARRILSGWAPAHAVVFRPDYQTDRALASCGLKMVSAPAPVARRLENKRHFRTLCRDTGLPVAEFIEITWPPDGDRQRQVDTRMPGMRIVQTARGYAGHRTWLWSPPGRPELPVELTGHEVMVSSFIQGPTWTANGVVSELGVLVGAPMLQINGDERLSDLPFGSAGVEFNGPGVDAVRENLTDLTTRVGELARAQGFRGFFGIDAVLDEDGLHLIEMNARLTATLTAATLAELELPALPLTVCHVLACIGEPVPVEPLPELSELRGGHLILRQSGERRYRVPPIGMYRASGGAQNVVLHGDIPGGRTDRERLREGFEGLEGGASCSGTDRGSSWNLERLSGSGGRPPEDAVTIWPAGATQGGPTEDRCRLLFSSPMVGPDGRFLDAVEQVLQWVIRGPDP